jgi:NDP-sugar pyrophosphorylase family protein
MARYLAGSPLLLIAGDAMLEADLTPLLAAHRASGAFASLGTLAVDDPSQYGVVQTEADGRIIRFQEKPDPGAEISRQANTGIYIFEPGILDMIPTNTFHDFALHVFPEIMRRGLPFFAFPVQGYWTDVGNPRDYLQANLDYLDGRIGDPPVENLIAPDAEVRYAQLSRCVVGAGAVLPAGTSLRDSVVWPGTVLDAPLDATAAILTPWGHYRVDGAEARDLSLAAPLRAVG